MSTEDQIRKLQEAAAQIRRLETDGSLMLVDIAASTRFKALYPAEAWLGRLVEFQTAVFRVINHVDPKLLGDGILFFFPRSNFSPAEVLELGHQVLASLESTSAERRYTADFRLRCRVVLDYGRVFIFNGRDPQGIPVDRLFKIEKFVPAGSIGFTQDFLDQTGLKHSFPLGRFLVPGVSQGRLDIFLASEPDRDSLALVDKQRERSALMDIWSIGRNNEGAILIIGGRIPGEAATDPDTVQSGDKEALVEAALAIARAGRMDDVQLINPSESPDQHLRENIVAIGGPYHNTWTRRLMRECRSPLIFDLEQEDIPLIDQARHQEHRVRRESVSPRSFYERALARFSPPPTRIRGDVGFFGRIRNPLNFERHVILICGIETYGVLGAARLMGGIAKNAHFMGLHQYLMNTVFDEKEGDFRDFYILLKFDIGITGNVEQDTLEIQKAGIISDWNPEAIAELQKAPGE